MFCGKCGRELKEGAKFCGHCGNKIEYNGNVNANPNNYYDRNLYADASNNRQSALIPIIVSVIIIISVVIIIFALKISDINDFFDSNGNITETAIPTSAPTAAVTATPTAEPSAPVFSYATASSTRGTDTEGGRYSENSVLSFDNMSKWVPSKASNGGIGEWIQINADQAQYVRGIEILNGYHKNGEIWRNNNRVRSCTLSFSNGQSQSIMLNDTMDLIKISLPEPISTTYIRLTINSYYSGAKWNDTAITYFSAY